MKRILRRLLHTEEGQDLIEYGLLAAFISIAALAAVKAIGPLVVVLYEAVVTAMTP
ncbi:MAG: Flp family type IVb pilin [candidate division Zixibacteria bacterium]|nr:Flp family type IVb pilin [candidate division Zixibacteria bacterium]